MLYECIIYIYGFKIKAILRHPLSYKNIFLKKFVNFLVIVEFNKWYFTGFTIALRKISNNITMI
ncbi:hypothetical protein CF050_03710 [Clostridium botulinum]|nr:hypothetical protein [Clostridium botulinum]